MIKLDSSTFDLEVQKNTSFYVIKFGSTTCGPCNTMAPVLSKLDQENPHVNIFEVDTNESPEIAAHFNIRSVPTIHFCEGREILYTFNGVTPFRDLQYVIDNINDEYFRKFGEFKSQAKKNYFYPILFVTIVFFISLLMVI